MENYLDLVCALDHMVVGDNIPVAADNKSRPQTSFLPGLGLPVLKRGKKPFQPLLVSAKGGSKKMLEHPTPSLDGFLGLNIDHPCLCMLCQLGKAGWHHLY